jgi:hypothetical protein
MFSVPSGAATPPAVYATKRASLAGVGEAASRAASAAAGSRCDCSGVLKSARPTFLAVTVATCTLLAAAVAGTLCLPVSCVTSADKDFDVLVTVRGDGMGGAGHVHVGGARGAVVQLGGHWWLD